MSDVTETNPFYYGRKVAEQIAGAPVVEKKLKFDPNIVVRKTVVPASLPNLPVPVFPKPEDFVEVDSESNDALNFLEGK